MIFENLSRSVVEKLHAKVSNTKLPKDIPESEPAEAGK